MLDRDTAHGMDHTTLAAAWSILAYRFTAHALSNTVRRHTPSRTVTAA